MTSPASPISRSTRAPALQRRPGGQKRGLACSRGPERSPDLDSEPRRAGVHPDHRGSRRCGISRSHGRSPPAVGARPARPRITRVGIPDRALPRRHTLRYLAHPRLARAGDNTSRGPCSSTLSPAWPYHPHPMP
jgi:hypothetical protein